LKRELHVSRSIELDAGASRVWDALTNPEMIRQYLFGTTVITDWQVGSEIIFQGSWQGKEYRDKGKIERFENEKLLQYMYWSGFSGLEDRAENYSLVTFRLGKGNDDGGPVTLTVSQNGFADEAARDHADSSWGAVLQKIKEIVAEK
jgi:uncharacterized protein YndB with AHSA1/START domain